MVTQKCVTHSFAAFWQYLNLYVENSLTERIKEFVGQADLV